MTQPINDVLEEDYSWLELDEIPERLYNPLDDFDFENDPLDSLAEVLCDSQYLHFAAKSLLNIDLLVYQTVILDTLWHKRLPMLIGTRGLGKSFMLAVYALLRMIFHPGCKIVIVGSGFRQAKNIFDAMMTIYDNAPVLKDLLSKQKNQGPKREVDMVKFTIGKSTAIGLPLGDGSKIRGMRANYILCDEFASIPIEIFNVVVQGFGIVSSNPVEKVKEEMLLQKLKEAGQWTDEMERKRRKSLGGNQIVYSGTAFYSFNHFCEYFEKWKAIILSKGNPEIISELFGDDSVIQEGFDYKDYAVMRIPWHAIPPAFLDRGMLAQAKATLSPIQFLIEYCAVFPKDSDGFYRRSVIESATTNKPVLSPLGTKVQFSASRQGQAGKQYVIGVDPAASDDNAAIVVLEVYPDHRRIVYCWTTNKEKFNQLKIKGVASEDDYYKFVARKIRDIMKVFAVEQIVMDSQGGGLAISEILGDPGNCEDHEIPIYEIIEEGKEKISDMKEGLHILTLVKPTNDYNLEANHGMLKDLQIKALMFPAFDSLELARAIEIDQINNLNFDTYEDLVEEIESLKDELTTIVCMPTPTGKERFDTPEIKIEGQQKGRLRKDRYSALLYANKFCRDKELNKPLDVEYVPVGATKDTLKKTSSTDQGMYKMIKPKQLKNSNWIKKPGVASIKNRRRNG